MAKVLLRYTHPSCKEGTSSGSLLCWDQWEVGPYIWQYDPDNITVLVENGNTRHKFVLSWVTTTMYTLLQHIHRAEWPNPLPADVTMKLPDGRLGLRHLTFKSSLSFRPILKERGTGGYVVSTFTGKKVLTYNNESEKYVKTDHGGVSKYPYIIEAADDYFRGFPPDVFVEKAFSLYETPASLGLSDGDTIKLM